MIKARHSFESAARISISHQYGFGFFLTQEEKAQFKPERFVFTDYYTHIIIWLFDR